MRDIKRPTLIITSPNNDKNKFLQVGYYTINNEKKFKGFGNAKNKENWINAFNFYMNHLDQYLLNHYMGKAEKYIIEEKTLLHEGIN